MPKVCSLCKKLLSLHFYIRDNSKKSGFREQCKICISNKNRERYKNRSQENVNKRQTKDKTWRQRNPEKCLWRDAKRRAINKLIPFTIVQSDIIIPKMCPVLNIELFHGEKTICDNSPTLDRIIPEQGYVPGNIVVLSNKANRLKNDGTLAEHQKLVSWLESFVYAATT